MYDKAETERRGYSGKSKVYFDGREVLKGEDWKNRKLELWIRGNGRCERIIGECVNYDKGYPYLNGQEVRCSSEMHDPHHIVKRSKKRDDRIENLIGLCRMHHDLLDERKPRLRLIA